MMELWGWLILDTLSPFPIRFLRGEKRKRKLSFFMIIFVSV
jgi:hypothetical protein